MPVNFQELSNFIWSVADLLRGPYRPPQYERVMLPMTVLRRFDCLLASTKQAVLAKHQEVKIKPDTVREVRRMEGLKRTDALSSEVGSHAPRLMM